MKDSLQKFEKKILIQGFKPIDFTPEGGTRFTSCKVTYSYEGDGETEFGLVSKEINFPYEYCDKFKGCKFPVSGVITFTCENLTVKPKLVDLKILGGN